MSEYFAEVKWERRSQESYTDNKYSRAHVWTFDGGMSVDASASPHIVPLPYSVEAYVDPEEAFIASLSSCHMLFFLSIAAKRKFVVDSYVDNAAGLLEKGQDNKISMTSVTLRPKVIFSGDNRPTMQDIEVLHHQSHERCFIANSVTTKIIIDLSGQEA